MDSVNSAEFRRHLQATTLLDHEWSAIRKRVTLIFLRLINDRFPFVVRYRYLDPAPGCPAQVSEATWQDLEFPGVQYFQWQAGQPVSIKEVKNPIDGERHQTILAKNFADKLKQDLNEVKFPCGHHIFVVASPRFPPVISKPGVHLSKDPDLFTMFMHLYMAFPEAARERVEATRLAASEEAVLGKAA